jgi:hypothetical protein
MNFEFQNLRFFSDSTGMEGRIELRFFSDSTKILVLPQKRLIPRPWEVVFIVILTDLLLIGPDDVPQNWLKYMLNNGYNNVFFSKL